MAGSENKEADQEPSIQYGSVHMVELCATNFAGCDVINGETAREASYRFSLILSKVLRLYLLHVKVGWWVYHKDAARRTDLYFSAVPTSYQFSCSTINQQTCPRNIGLDN